MRSRAALSLRKIVRLLRTAYGPPETPPTKDPFELVLYENIAYLAAPVRRREAFELLRKTIGTGPAAILGAHRSALESITRRGILGPRFAEKLRECARIALEEFAGDLAAATRGPVPEAKRALTRFPGIGEPGAEKILLFSGRQALLAPESNGLRVLTRLGLVREEKSYVKTWAGSRATARDLPKTVAAFAEAHGLLARHGQNVCKRSVPLCEACALRKVCAYAVMRESSSGLRR